MTGDDPTLSSGFVKLLCKLFDCLQPYNTHERINACLRVSFKKVRLSIPTDEPELILRSRHLGHVCKAYWAFRCPTWLTPVDVPNEQSPRPRR